MHNKNYEITLPLKLSFLVFSMVLNCMGIIILQNSKTHISYSNLGFLEVFKDLPIALISLFAVNYINKFGRKKSLIFALFVVAISCMLLPFLTEFWFLKVWFSVIGISFAIAKISVYGIIRNNIHHEMHFVKVMSSVEASFMIGIFIVNAGFGFLINSIYSNSWKFGFWLISFFAFIIICLLSKTKITEGGHQYIGNPFSTLSKFFNKKNLLFLMIIFSIVFIEQNFNSWLPLYYKNHLKVNSFFALQASAFLALFSYIGRMITSKIIQKFSINRYFINCVLIILSILIVCQFLVSNHFFNITIFVLPLIGLFIAPLYPVINSKMISNIQKNEINIFTSLIIIFSSLGSSLGSISMSLLFQYNLGNYFAFFISLFVIILLVISFFYFQSFRTKNQNN